MSIAKIVYWRFVCDRKRSRKTSVFCDSLMRLSVGVAKALLDFSQFWIKNNYPLAVIVLPGLFERLSSLGWTRRTATVEKKTPARTMRQKMCRIGLPAYVRAGVRFLQRLRNDRSK